MTRNLGPTLPLSEEIHKTKYRSEGESFREAMNRVAYALKDDDEHFHNLRNILLEQRFMPAGRVQAAMGSTRYVTAHNCYVMGVIKDSFCDSNGIMDRAKEAAQTMRMGGGVGYDFSTLRPRGELIKTLQSRSSGPVSFMGIFNEICLCTSSAGHRRGAQMGILRVDHPDIEEFIHAKQNEERLKGFNISIGITDEFMRAVRDNTDFDLRWGGRVYKTIYARTLWEAVMRSTWDYAEPGVIFIDRINQKNNLWYCEDIAATNPCVSGDTLVLTSEGHQQIQNLVDKEVDVWNGTEWSSVTPYITGYNQNMLRVRLSDGLELDCTPYHNFYLSDGTKVEASELRMGDKIEKNGLPVVEGKEEHKEAYTQGFFSGDGYVDKRDGRCYVDLHGDKHEVLDFLQVQSWYENDIHGGFSGTDTSLTRIRCYLGKLQSKLFVPGTEWDVKSRIKWLEGLVDADACLGGKTDEGQSVFIYSNNNDFLKSVQLMLQTLGVHSHLSYRDRDGKNLGLVLVSSYGVTKLKSLGFDPVRLNVRKISTEVDRRQYQKVVAIEDLGTYSTTYCFTEPKAGRGTFNGIVTGQCGEQPLPPYGACLLGSFNLVKYVKPVNGHPVDPRFEGNGYYFDVEQLRGDVPKVVRAMDNVIDQSIYPLSEQRDEALDKRRMGLGVTGVANALETMGYLYGDKDMVALFETIMATITQFAYEASAGLAAEKGAFPKFDKEKYLQGEFIKSLPKRTQEMIAKYGIRNSHLMSIAPTGTISLSADNVSSGIEPVFSTHFHRNVGTFDGFRTERVDDYAYRMFGTRGRLTEECSVDHHIRMLVAANKYVDSSVSKTCNVSPMMPWEEFKRVYFDAWRGDCKGCTTFNPGGRRMGILNNAEESDGDEEQEVVSGASCVRDPETGKIDCE